jgi:DNA repair protein RadC
VDLDDSAAGRGHRDRLRRRFLKSGLDGFSDYEVVELLLTLVIPRRDTKPAAKEALRRFGTLRGVLEAPEAELATIPELGAASRFALKFIPAVARELLREKSLARAYSCHSPHDVYNYLCQAMRGLDKEVFKVLFLNSQNEIIAEEDLFSGTVDRSAVFPREVIKSALSKNAASLILVHNHPSGNPTPSQNDKDLTRDMAAAANLVQISVLDHVIIGSGEPFSFAAKGLLAKNSI